ncbi:MAG: thiamine pyrophosphate-dependent dehydrogenase E1 component subunit alpha [Clostridiales Family XIII bacterium]|jgi:pyruvate dehydrogenase E1 component alpha subunit|nr:thiamine pyrophosphate-dependent dehydrogenase E1 component subunit alpha [Clostridiales Family XIII bacterium]
MEITALEKLLEHYRMMLTIREFELRAASLYEAAEILGFVHLYAGEEAIAAGVCGHLTEKDYITSTHRGHGHLIAKGGKLRLMMAELFGKSTGYCGGKGGSMHICDPSLGILGSNGIVGAGFPIATGAGLAAKTYGDGAVSVCFFGDAASNRGTFHESLNLAAVWNLPVIYVCENNQYGISMNVKDAMKVEHVADRGAAYGIKSATIDGNDVIAVSEAMEGILKDVRDGGGPFLLECMTWRHRGHFEGDPDFCNDYLYRSKEEDEYWLARDPIAGLRNTLVDEYGIGLARLDRVRAEILRELDDAVEFARQSPEPDASEMLRGVFA